MWWHHPNIEGASKCSVFGIFWSVITAGTESSCSVLIADVPLMLFNVLSEAEINKPAVASFQS